MHEDGKTYANFIILKAEYSEKNAFTVKYDWNYAGAKFTDQAEGENPPDELAGVRWTQSGFTPYSWDDAGTLRPAFRPGCNLTGWTTNSDGSGTLVIPGTQYNALVGNDDTTSVTLYAQWEEASFLVQYDTNGGTPPAGLAEEYKTRKVGYYDANLLPTSFDRPGYELSGWNVIQGGSKRDVQQKDAYGELADHGETLIVLQAQWRAKDYTVKYDLDGSHVAGDPDETAIGQRDSIKWYTASLLPSESVEKMGYLFKRWRLSQIGANTVVEGETVTNQRYQDLAAQQETDNGSITLKAIWEVKGGYQVNYDLDGGYFGAETSIEPKKNLTWESKDLLPGTVTKAGYTFTGWKVAAGGNEAANNANVTEASAYGDLALDDTAMKITLAAQWAQGEKVQITYEKQTKYSNGDNRLQNDGGEIDKTSELVDPATGDPSAKATSYTGYTFEGWYQKGGDGDLTKIEGAAAEFKPSKTKYADGEAYEAAAYVAVFQEKADITIKYETVNLKRNPDDTNPGGKVSLESVTLAPATGTIKASTATAAAGYDFMGWFEKNTNYTGTPITKSETCIPEKTDNAYAEKTYVAVFQEKDDITITYERDNLNASDSNLGGTINSFAERLPPVTGKIEGSTASPAAGYEFVGWFVKSGEEYDPSAPVEPNLTCTPKQAGGVYQPVTYVAVFREQGNVTIRYSATAGGEISRTAEGIAPVLGEAVGSVATANPGFVLVGWYNATDKEFVSLLSDEAHFIPARAGGLNAAGSYVARFTESPDITVKYLATPGGTVSRGSESTAPVTGVLKGATAKATAGCDFAGWYSNGKLISQDETFVPAKTADNVYESGTYVAMFVEKIDVSSSYQVEHYAVGGDKPFSTETFSGIIKSKVTAVPKNYTGYTYQNGAAGEIKTGTVTADGSLILKLYYTTAAYEINYVVNGAVPNGAVSKLPAVSDAAYDSTQTVAAAPAFVGYTFSGWRTADCMVDDQGKFTMPAGNVTFYGAWIPDTASSVASYKVEYYLEGRTAPYETDILQGTVGTIVSAVEKDGYTGYSYDAGNASNVTSGTVTVDGNLYYALNKHDVKYEIVGNAPAGAPSVQNVLNVPYGTTQEVASSSSMTYAGYVFTIWGTKDCSVHNGEFTMPDTDVTFMGSWIPLGGSQQAVYRVEHYLNNQLYETEEFQGVAGNTAAAIPKTGYLGCTYDDANPSNVKSGTLSADAPLVLKLYYTSDQYTVKYYVGGVQQESTNARYGDPMYVTAEPTNPGFIFSGWHTADCAVNADGTFTMPAGDVTFYGSWITESVLNASGYKIEHYLVNGQGAATLHETEVLKGLSETPATAIPKIGYEGYVYDKTYTGNVETGVINDSGTLVLKLYYFPGRYQVRYSMTGDVPPGVPGAPADKTADYGSPVKVEDVPFYAGYTFSGWQTADTAVADGAFSMPGHDVAFTGVWTKNPEMFTVTFVDWDGTPLKSEYVPYGWDSTAPEDPARSGYTFTGWDTPYTNVQESITVQAKYSENTKDGPSLASDKPSSNVPAGPSSDNPNGGPGSQAPLTGDSNHLLLWIVMALASALGVLAWRKRTRNIS